MSVMGRFMQVDPIEGGNANNYVYPGDPVNSVDLDGEFAFLIPVAIFVGRIAVQQGVKYGAKQVAKKTTQQVAKNYGKRGVVSGYKRHALGRMAGTRGGPQMSPQAVQYITRTGKRTYDAIRGTYNYETTLGKVVLNSRGEVVTVIAKSGQAAKFR